MWGKQGGKKKILPLNKLPSIINVLNSVNVNELFNSLNLLDKKEVLVSDLSVGQKKRVSIAKWLLTDAQLYLIDEPFSALDDQGHKAVEDLIKELINRGCSFLLTGHRKSNEEYGAFHLD